MNFGRSIPPAAAPITFRDLLRGLAGLFRGERRLKQLEQQLQEFFGVKHVFLVSSGKAALLLILAALKSLSKRKRVLIPAYTCFSVPSAVVKAGLTVSCCDIDPRTLDFDYHRLKDSLTDDTLCVVPTHLLGLPSDVDRVKDLCEGKGTFVVEDAAQAMGMKHGNRLAGTLGDVSFFSLGRGKNITCGSGGIIVTNCDSIARAIQTEYQKLTPEPLLGVLRNFCEVLAMRLLMDPRLYWLPSGLPFLGLGETKFYRDFPVHRMDRVRIGLLSSWQQRLRESYAVRSEAAKMFYDHLPPNCKTIVPPTGAKVFPNRLPVVMRSKRAKADLCAASKAKGLGISPLYPSAIPDIAELKGSFATDRFQGATRITDCLVTLPVHQFVNPNDVERICRLLEQLHEPTDEAKVTPSRNSLGHERTSVRA